MGYVWAAEAGAKAGGSGFWQLAMVLLGIGLLGLFGRWRKNRARPLPSAKELRERDQDPNRYRDAADKAIVEMLEMSRTLNAQVDTKIRLLNRLVKEAEEKTAALEKLLGLTGQALEKNLEGNMAALKTEGEATTSASSRQRAELAKTFVSDLQERIFLLHNHGKTVAEIAKATNLSTTEVKFTIENM